MLCGYFDVKVVWWLNFLGIGRCRILGMFRFCFVVVCSWVFS